MLDSPVLLDVLVEEADSFGPLKEFNAKFGNSTINQRAPPKKARRRRSIAVSVIKSIPEGKGDCSFWLYCKHPLSRGHVDSNSVTVTHKMKVEILFAPCVNPSLKRNIVFDGVICLRKLYHIFKHFFGTLLSDVRGLVYKTHE